MKQSDIDCKMKDDFLASIDAAAMIFDPGLRYSGDVAFVVSVSE